MLPRLLHLERLLLHVDFLHLGRDHANAGRRKIPQAAHLRTNAVLVNPLGLEVRSEAVEDHLLTKDVVGALVLLDRLGHRVLRIEDQPLRRTGVLRAAARIAPERPAWSSGHQRKPPMTEAVPYHRARSSASRPSKRAASPRRTRPPGAEPSSR